VIPGRVPAAKTTRGGPTLITRDDVVGVILFVLRCLPHLYGAGYFMGLPRTLPLPHITALSYGGVLVDYVLPVVPAVMMITAFDTTAGYDCCGGQVGGR